jgi:hypothetical protein
VVVDRRERAPGVPGRLLRRQRPHRLVLFRGPGPAGGLAGTPVAGQQPGQAVTAGEPRLPLSSARLTAFHASPGAPGTGPDPACGQRPVLAWCASAQARICASLIHEPGEAVPFGRGFSWQNGSWLGHSPRVGVSGASRRASSRAAYRPRCCEETRRPPEVASAVYCRERTRGLETSAAENPRPPRRRPGASEWNGRSPGGHGRRIPPAPAATTYIAWRPDRTRGFSVRRREGRGPAAAGTPP